MMRASARSLAARMSTRPSWLPYAANVEWRKRRSEERMRRILSSPGFRQPGRAAAGGSPSGLRWGEAPKSAAGLPQPKRHPSPKGRSEGGPPAAAGRLLGVGPGVQDRLVPGAAEGGNGGQGPPAGQEGGMAEEDGGGAGPGLERGGAAQAAARRPGGAAGEGARVAGDE